MISELGNKLFATSEKVGIPSLFNFVVHDPIEITPCTTASTEEKIPQNKNRAREVFTNVSITPGDKNKYKYHSKKSSVAKLSVISPVNAQYAEQ
ncbi:hypothetical protein DICVIV_00901 [Dictyocaulus viviparus]|uniref:Uncharacterized protein n=1 Tax=Dictyocaulus viviparus TaxID=29172 RepID=A0A0D8YE13_DICVI|nr:hypothetical protein DICVIV_00901 [Dictyocaulus viviparus]